MYAHIHTHTHKHISSTGKMCWYHTVESMSVTWMHTYTDPQRDARKVQEFKGLHKTQHVQGHVSYVHRMSVSVAFGQTWCDHVSITDCLNLKDNICVFFAVSFLLQKQNKNKTLKYLVDVMMVKNAVKVLVDVIEHVDHFHGRAVVAECGKAHDVTEIDSDLLKQLWLHFARLLQGAHHRAEGRENGTVIWMALRGLASTKSITILGKQAENNNEYYRFKPVTHTAARRDQQPYSGRFKIHSPYQLVFCQTWLMTLMKEQFAGS